MPLQNLFTDTTASSDGSFVNPEANTMNGFTADVSASASPVGGVNVQITGVLVLILLVALVWLAMKWPVP